MGLKCNNKCPYERKAEGDYRQKRRRQCDQRGRDWSDAATELGILSQPQKTRRDRNESSIRVLRVSMILSNFGLLVLNFLDL